MRQSKPILNDMATWARPAWAFAPKNIHDQDGHFWIEQNSSKKSRWAKLAREGDTIAWEFNRPGDTYTGRNLVDGQIYSPSEATTMFLE